MAKFIVQGGKPLKGEVLISGSKNAALPILCASMLTKEKVILKNVPNIADIHTMIKILRAFGAKIKFQNNEMEISARNLKSNGIPNDVIKKMRASILILGGLLPRLGELKIAFPGGCVLGKRSVHAHTHAFQKLGCEIVDDKNGIHIKCKKLYGRKIILPELSVTATENAVMASVLAEGTTEIRLAATEPHVQDLCRFLNKIGAKISNIGTNNLVVKGVKTLKGATYKITGDYLEAGTFAIAAAATQSDIIIKGIDANQLDSFWQKLEEAGIKFELSENSAHIFPSKKLDAVKILRTAVYPSFPTDLQAPFAVLLTQAHGVSKIFETLFEGRLNYLFELEKMGGHIEYLNPHQALIIGQTILKPLAISSCDIRAGAAMVVAALIAKGKTEISNINYIDRGYEKFDEKLRKLGADIVRV
ncbi:UDP-N-acetylglucosamine 1-carboxyvinyltransferase [Candidatus Peregrinibacteria bacterium RIFCSPLOWO2_01_FULL_39_12]|nr:MAG: UDP-N-acetylglucosamine 1-carboxyvinyltransferase [Candidatus Peregrinibacteria bacterium RIFCSPLOWO2_01_FULL_39_12]